MRLTGTSGKIAPALRCAEEVTIYNLFFACNIRPVFAPLIHGPRWCVLVLGVILAARTALAAPLPPTSIRPSASDTAGAMTLTWDAVAGAVSYQVRRGAGPTANIAVLGNTTTTNFTDMSGTPGEFAYYTVSAVDATGEGPATRGVRAAPAVIQDNTAPGGSASGVSTTGDWLSSAVAGSHGVASVYASPTNGPTSTATYSFAPDLPARGGYDIYLRWTAAANRATNTPVDVIFPDGAHTFSVNQTTNGGQWNLLTTVPAEAGASVSVVLRNNGASGFVVADGVQFVPRHAPWAPGAEPHAYTVPVIDEHFDGTAIDGARWQQFLDRPHFSVSGGKLRLRTVWAGPTPLAQATPEQVADEANWAEGGIVSRQSQKFGYHEARLRIPPPAARGVDTAYWHQPSDEVLNGYEIDAPEFFNRDSTGATNRFAFGTWDHFLPTRATPGLPAGRTWEYAANNPTIEGADGFLTIGLEWRTDNTQAIYVNGQKLAEVPTSAMNDVESILPSSAILSTKVLDWLGPSAGLDGAEAQWDYVRYFQKPGWLGAASADWADSANWGPDGLPGPGRAAVFNLSAAQTSVNVAGDQSLSSLSFDGAALPAMTFAGTGRLVLGERAAGDTTLTHGGIVLNAAVATDQTFNLPVAGRRSLQFANVSRVPGATLRLNGPVSGQGPEPCDVDFASTAAGNTALGGIVLDQPLGPGLRHVNRAGDIPFTLPSGSQHSGELRIARGTVNIADPSALGTDLIAAVVFKPNFKHSDAFRPRLVYLGPTATIARPLVIAGRQADAVIEADGPGALTLTGPVQLAPSWGDPKTALTRDGDLLLRADSSAAIEHVLAGATDDRGVLVEYLNEDGSTNSGPATLSLAKSGPGTWVLAGDHHLAEPVVITGGRLVVGQGTAGSLNLRTSPRTGAAPSVTVSSGAEIVFGRDDAATFGAAIGGSGGLRKRGAGPLTLTGTHAFSGPVNVDAGLLRVNGALTAGRTVNVGAAGSLAGSGSLGGGADIQGAFEVSPLAVQGTLTLRSTAAIRAVFASNAPPTPTAATAQLLAITNGARVDVVPGAAGSTADFRHVFWRSTRTFPLVTAGSRTGTLALGTVSADSAGQSAGGFGSFSLEHTATGVNLVWTPIPGYPEYDYPAINLSSPPSGVVSLPDTAHILTLTAAATGGIVGPVAWTVVSGPGAVTFGNPASATTTASFAAAGTYVLRLTASNPLGTATRDVTVNVAPPSSLVLREGSGGSHPATFIRSDTPSWNSGARDQILVGRNSAAFRSLLAFELTAVPPGSSIVSASLELRVAATGGGTSVGPLDLHRLIPAFVEGTGNGLSATNGTGTGADWSNRLTSAAWTSAGASADADRDPVPLQSHPAFNPTATNITGFALDFTNSTGLTAVAAQSLAAAEPLRLLLKAAVDTSGSNGFVRIASDDHADTNTRPRLVLGLAHSFAPTVASGPGTAAFALHAAPLTGSAIGADAVRWSVASGPGTASFASSSSPATTVEFSAPGNYQLRLSATNAHGETSRLLAVAVLTSREGWRQGWFGTTANAGDAHDNADPDRDGVANFLEFALGGNPIGGGPVPITPDDGNGQLHLDYFRPATAAALSFSPEWTDHLATPWATNGVTTTILSEDATGRRLRSSVPIPPDGQRFLRLKIREF
jgi:autotransporter-associated beta strand protein